MDNTTTTEKIKEVEIAIAECKEEQEEQRLLSKRECVRIMHLLHHQETSPVQYQNLAENTWELAYEGNGSVLHRWNPKRGADF